MKKKNLWPCVPAIMLVFSMMAVGCDNGTTGNGNPQKVEYQSTDTDGNTYILTITKNTSAEDTQRAAYTVAVGDYYVLTIKIKGQPDKVSEGAVYDSTGVMITLKPTTANANAPNFSVTITVSGGQITKIDGTITFKDGGTLKGPGAIWTGGGVPTAKGKLTINGFPSNLENMYVYADGPLGVAGATKTIYAMADAAMADTATSVSDVAFKMVKITNGSAVVPLYTLKDGTFPSASPFIAYDGNDTVNGSIGIGIGVFETPALTLREIVLAILTKQTMGSMQVKTGTFTNGNLTVKWAK